MNNKLVFALFIIAIACTTIITYSITSYYQPSPTIREAELKDEVLALSEERNNLIYQRMMLVDYIKYNEHMNRIIQDESATKSLLINTNGDVISEEPNGTKANNQ